MPTDHYKYIVLGAGISGLTAALELQSKGENVAVLEREGMPGGVLQSIRNGNYTWDRAAHTLAVDENIKQFLDKYNVSELLIKPSEAAKVRQIAIGEKIWDISNHPVKILGAKFLSFGAKMKLLRELFKQPIKLNNPTVYEFFDYHFGTEITKNIISAVFAGIYAGDIEKMEMKSVMSKVFNIEQESGSLIRGLIKNKSNLGGRMIYGLNGGMDGLGNKLSQQLNSISYNSEVQKITKTEGRFILHVGGKIYTCDHLISTLPAYALRLLLADVSESLTRMLGEIHYAPMVLIHVGFANVKEHIARKAFGFLCSQFDSPVLKGAIYNGDLFEDRAPSEGKSYTIFMKPRPEWLEDEVKLDAEIAKTIAHFKKLTQITTKPEVVEKSVWENAIPQFNKPYAQLKSSMLSESENIAGFTLSGSYISGVSVSDCIKYNIDLVKKHRS